MAAQKRKTTLVEDSAKRRRLDKGNKWTAATSKKKKVPPAKRSANKSKQNVGTVQKKKEPKSSVKPNRTGTKKAVQPSRQKKTVQKQTQLSSKTPTKKTVFVKNAPIKRTTLKSPSRTASSVSKKSHANLSKSSQNNKVLKVTKSSSSTTRVQTNTSEKKVAASLLKSQAQHQLRPSTAEKKCAAKTLSVQSAKSSLMKSVRMLNKTIPRTTKLDVQATRNSSRNIPVTLVKTRTSNKTDLGKHMQSPKGDMSRKPAGRETTLSLQKSCRGSPRDTQEMHSCRTSRSLVATSYNVAQVDKVKSPEPRPNKRQPVSDSRRSRRLQATLDVSSKSLCNERKSGKAKQNTAVKKGQVLKVKSRQLNQKKGNLAISRTKYNKKGKMEQEVSRNCKETKNKGVRKTQKEKAAGKVVRKLSSRSSLETNQQQLKISAEQSLHQEIERDQKVSPASSVKDPKGQAIAVQATTVKAKGGQKLGSKQALCQKVKSKLKPKLPQLQEPDIKPAQEPENDSKAKRISILELCEEIAGEIESDTVEVIKEVANAEEGKEEETPEKPQQEHKETEAQKLTLCDQSQSNPSKCFFPSRKALPVKCKINGKTSPTTKNSKWNKIKLKKASLMNRNHVTKPTALPNLELLKRTKAPLATQCDSAESHCPKKNSQPLVAGPQKECGNPNQIKMDETPLEIGRAAELRPGTFRPVVPTENGQISEHAEHELEAMPDETFRLHLESSPENTPEKCTTGLSPPNRAKLDNGEKESPGSDPKLPVRNLFSTPASEMGEKWVPLSNGSSVEKTQSLEVNIQKEIKKLKDAEKESDKQLVIDAGQKRFGAISCNVCGMLYTASNPEDETQHLLFHNQFISAVKYVGWKKERIVAEYPDGRVIMVFPDDPKYALKKVEEIREMVDNDLGFQQVPLKLHSRTKTLLFISNDKKVAGCLIAEHIQWGYRVIDEKIAEGDSERERANSERQKAWCCSTSPEPAICGISRIWVFGMMRRKKIASRMLECLRNNFIYGSYLSKDEIAFSDPTPDGKLFATQYCETSQFLVYNFLNGQQLAS
ncbi:N-acetyltransferase ESCO1 isoform X2 [Microcaecilia unicolor]|uniref:N-acetyltransferase ESCO1 isoform X2 n=1 Tax=Microcaecilia unicolor TaxID=1415580 RepID=A0A6P7YZ10_9AMPH|nr:N-acetyltransferase ESCO1 isoform X2 [Microcaecilia unicolor]